MLVFAHAGHWLVQLIYAVPLVIMAGLVAVSYIRQRRNGEHPRPPKKPSA
jgi:hypothetical protein